MKKAILSLALLLAGTLAGAQPYVGTRAATSGGITLLQSNDGTWIHMYGSGAPTFSTFLGDNVPANTIYTNTATAANYFHVSGTTWTLSSAGTASALTPGTTTVGSTTSCLVYSDASSKLECDSTNLTMDDSGTANATIRFSRNMSGGSAFSNFFGITGTLPTTLTAQTEGVLFQFTGAGSSGQSLFAQETILAAGYTGAGATRAYYGLNQAAGTADWSLSFTTAAGNTAGYFGMQSAATVGTNFGVVGFSQNGTISVGVFGVAPTAKNSGTNIGVIGIANNAGATPIRVGGYFGLNTTLPTFPEAALVANNGAIAAPIQVWQDNGTTQAQFRDGGTFAGRDAIAGTDSDTAGGALTLGGGSGTGTGKGGNLVIQTTPSTTTGTTSLTPYDRVTFAAKAVALTDAATILFTVNTLGAHKRSGGTLEFTVQASDGTNDQVATGRTYWGAVDTTAGAGGETCTNLVDGLTISAAASGAASSGTLVITADATTGTDLCNFRITPAGSLSETTYNVYYWITKNLPDGAVSLP